MRVRRDAFVMMPTDGVLVSRPVRAPFGAHVCVETFRMLCGLLDIDAVSIFGCLATDSTSSSVAVLDVPAVLARIVSLLLILRVNVHLLVLSGEAGSYVGALVSETGVAAVLRRRHPGVLDDGGGGYGGGSPLLFQELKAQLLRLALSRGDGVLAVGVSNVRRLAVGCLSAGMDVFFATPESQLEILRECVFGDAGLDPAAVSAAAVTSSRSVFDLEDSDDSDSDGLPAHLTSALSAGGHGQASMERSEFYSEIILHFTSSSSAARLLFDRLMNSSEGDVAALMFGLLSLAELRTRLSLEALRVDVARAHDEEKKAETDAVESGGGKKLGYDIDLLLMFQRELLSRAFGADGAALHGAVIAYSRQLLKAAQAAVDLASGIVGDTPSLGRRVERLLEGSFVGLALPAVAAALAIPCAATVNDDGVTGARTRLPLFSLLGVARSVANVARSVIRLVQKVASDEARHQPSFVRSVRVYESAHPWRRAR